MDSTLLVLGDSIPLGERTDAVAWPQRLPSLVDGLANVVHVHGSMGTELASLAADLDGVLREHADGDDPLVVLVHAGHNDAQLSGGEPRVTEVAFRDAAAALDRALAGHPAVARHAFVGLVPLLSLDEPGAVPFSDEQPDRSLVYDDFLAETVETHLAVARPVEEWDDRTEDGVHPNETGHAFVADRVAEWFEERDE